jgi:dihydrolipoamide dehydrogenase
MESFDLIVIGSGPGGYVAAIRAAQLGLKVAVIEREALGGICLNWGCIPTKALLKSADVVEYAQHAKDYGVNVSNVSHDFPAVVKRSRGVADTMSKGVQFLLKKNKIEAIFGTAKLNRSKQVEVTDAAGAKKSYTAKNIIIATGGRSRELPGIAIDNKKILGYRDAMVLPTQPKRMIVMGSGAIGTEFAYFYQTMGTQVTVVEFMDNMLPLEDEEISKTIVRLYQKKGMEILVKSKVTSVDTSGPGVKATIETPEGVKVVEADVLLSAVGVIANIENLGLEELGVKTDKGKIVVDADYRTNVTGIWAIGDCVPGPALAHKASAEGIHCAEVMAGHHPQPIDYGNVPACTYCQPEVASVGLTEKRAKELGYQVKVGKFPFKASGKAQASGKTEGFVKVVFDAKYGEFLGAHMLGAGVTDLIAEVVVARKLETTGHEIIKSIHPHPTLSEAVMEAAADAFGEVIHL